MFLLKLSLRPLNLSKLVIASSIFISSFSLAATVNKGTDDVIDPFEPIPTRCKEAVECRLLTEDDFLGGHILKVDQGATYPDRDNNEMVADKNGYYVGILDEFIPVSKIGASPDGNYYVCENSPRVLDDETMVDIDELLLPKDELDYLLENSEFCPSFWAPEEDLEDFPVPPAPAPPGSSGGGTPTNPVGPGSPSTPANPYHPNNPGNPTTGVITNPPITIFTTTDDPLPPIIIVTDDPEDPIVIIVKDPKDDPTDPDEDIAKTPVPESVVLLMSALAAVAKIKFKIF